MIARRTQIRDQQGSPFLIGSLEPTMVRWSPFWRPWNRSNHLICYIDVTGLLAVLLLLLIMFMLKDPVCPPMRSGGVDLARVGSPVSMRGADREDALIVAVMRDGKLFLGSDPILPEQLPPRIRDGVNRGAEKKVYIRADARASYGYVKEVLDGIHAAGIERIGILVDRRKPASPIP